MGESNIVARAYTMYRHLQQYCTHPSIISKAVQEFELFFPFQFNVKIAVSKKCWLLVRFVRKKTITLASKLMTLYLSACIIPLFTQSF